VHGDQSRCATVDTEQLPMEPHRLLDRETAGKKTAGRPARAVQPCCASTARFNWAASTSTMNRAYKLGAFHAI
jgi:hypothetical protein